MGSPSDRRVILGRVVGLFGVQGWLKVHAYTEPRERITQYSPWLLGRGDDWREYRVEAGRRHGRGVIARLAGVTDRDVAAGLLGAEIAVWRSRLPPPPPGEYYWTDLEGLRVVTVGGRELGTVSHLFATGANDVLVVTGERERLIPFLPGRVVTRVDLEGRCLEVDWDPDF
ncbi:MAG TPA: ribosome maturation factor RimM [Gammaproteobacteria bacterium]|nr:ribosome maturation factor RimM [Gammaproteobacteria bacterium]